MRSFQLILGCIVVSFFLACGVESSDDIRSQKQSGAAISMDQWAAIRAYPEGKIHSSRLVQAHQERNAQLLTRNGDYLGSTWEAIGPKNFGGRTICMAFHPTDPATLFIGSASGGLWKTTTMGDGEEGWSYVPTGFPVLGVAAIAINPDNPDEMYIGTGEVYNYLDAKPGTIDRFTRGSYGIGILKTTDGGDTWEKSLDWSLQELTGIQDLVIDPDDPSTVYAATTEGLFKTVDSGANWTNILDIPMAVDIEMHPDFSDIFIVTFGNLNSPDSGIYRTSNGGVTFTQLMGGLPGTYSGKTMIAFSPSNPEVVYASVADVVSSIGLFRSDNMGDSWTNVNSNNVASYQGWYSHDVVVDPNDPDRFIWVGINTFISNDAGQSLEQVSLWNLWNFGQVPVGGSEGPPDYVHADIHSVYYHPLLEDVVLSVTDGGVFYSEDGGVNWEGRNGGLQTHQFYADFGNSQQDSSFAIGGLQDNASAIYIGDDAWVRILGGDGMTGAVHPWNDSIVLGSYYYLNISRSIDRGETFSGVNVESSSGEFKPFNSPFAFSPAVPDRIYAGAARLHRSDDLGYNWNATSAASIQPNNAILTIGLAHQNEDLIYVATVPGGNPPKVWKSTNGGQQWWELTSGLPDRICTDIVIDPIDQNVVYLTFSGFGTAHLYKTTDGGVSWDALENGLPDVPGNSVVVDPLNPSIVYFGNDLGVYVSFDAGTSWEPFCTGLPDAIMAIHLSYSPANRKIRLASHGSGVYEAAMLDFPTSSNQPELATIELRVFPNPAQDVLQVSWKASNEAANILEVFDASGRLVLTRPIANSNSGNQPVSCSLDGWSSGYYVVRVIDQQNGQLLGSASFIKQ